MNQEQEIIRMYTDEEKTLVELCSIFHLSFYKIKEILNNKNIEIRPCKYYETKRLTQNRQKWSGGDEISKSFWCRIKSGAKWREKEFNIGKEYALSILHDQKYICPLSGILLQLPIKSTEFFSQYTASLDRIDSFKGYIEGNIRWVFKDLNIMKGQQTDEEFYNNVKSVYKFNTRLYENKYDGVGSLKSINKYYITKVKYSAVTMHREFSLLHNDLLDLINNQNNQCALSGVKIYISENPKKTDKTQTASLDRIDSKLGYTLNNVQWVHKTINIMKRNLEDEHFYQWCRLCYWHLKERFEGENGKL
jgi:hypothetical protein